MREGCINMVDKIRPDATYDWSEGNDGRDSTYKIKYFCPKCYKSLYEGEIACDKCGTFFDWSKKAYIRMKPTIEWR